MLRSLRTVVAPRWVAVRQASTIYSAALIERRPVILPDPDPVEHKFWSLQQQIHEMRAAPLPKELMSAALREQERLTEERSKGHVEFEPAPRRTAADEANDTRSLDRALDRTLYLMIEEEQGWNFPLESLTDDDSLHLAAARAAQGQACTVSFIARAPVAHYDSADGATTFIHLAELLPTNKSAYDIGPLKELRGDSFGWFTKSEVIERCADKKLTEILEVLLVE